MISRVKFNSISNFCVLEYGRKLLSLQAKASLLKNILKKGNDSQTDVGAALLAHTSYEAHLLFLSSQHIYCLVDKMLAREINFL